MLEHGDASEALDERIAEALSRWTGHRPEAPSFTRTGKGIAGLRLLMEASAGAEGAIRRTLQDGVNVFVYSCRRPTDDRTVEGLGDSGNLAVCDAFLSIGPDYFAPVVPGTAARLTPPTRLR